MLWDHDIPFWKPIDKPNINFITDLFFTKNAKNWGFKMREMRVSKIFGFWPFCKNRPPLKLNSMNILCYAIF